MSDESNLNPETLDEGHAKREAAKRKAAALLAKADEVLNEAGVEAPERADPAKLKVDNEVASAIDLTTGEVLVSNAQPGMHYVWVCVDPSLYGRFVNRLKAFGWKVVSGNDPEAREHTFVDGSRRVADCMLMRCTHELYLKFQEMDRLKRQRQQEGATSDLLDLAAKVGVEVRTLDNMPGIDQALAQRADMERRQRLAGPPQRNRNTRVPSQDE